MLPPDPISNSISFLQAILEKLSGSQLVQIVANPDGSAIRLDLILNSALPVSGLSPILRLVITGQPQIFYLSYTQIAAFRTQVTEPESIVSKNLILQGAVKADLQTIILYCHAPDQVEAGELHLTGTGFHLYDEQYGSIEANLLLAMLQDQIKKE